MAEERPSQPVALGSAAARGEPKTAPAANAPTAPRRNVCREISRAIVGPPRLRHDPNCQPLEPRCRMTCRGVIEMCSNRDPAGQNILGPEIIGRHPGIPLALIPHRGMVAP